MGKQQIDLDDDASEAGTSDASDESSKSTDQDWKVWKKRYEGNTATVNRLIKQKTALEGQLAEIADKLEEEKGELQTKLTEEARARKAAEKQLNDEKTRADDLDGKLKATLGEREQRKMVHDKYKSLLEMFDDDLLRKPSEFKTPEEYDAYLQRMHKSVKGSTSDDADSEDDDNDSSETTDDVTVDVEVKTPAKKTPVQKAKGVVPPVGGRKSGKGAKRSSTEINRELWKLDIRNPDHKEKIDALEAELIAAED